MPRHGDVVLLHPLGLDGASWRYVALDGARRPDFPGHGARRGEPAAGLERMAAEVAAAIGYEGAHLVGISMGGVVAQIVALEWPERVRSLVLACTTSSASSTTLQARADAARVQQPRERAEEMISRWFPAGGADDPELATRIDTAVRPALTATGGEVMARCWEAVGGHRATERLAGVDVPVTLVGGARDSPAPEERMGPMQRVLPHSRLLVIDCGHMPHVEVPAEFQAVVERHLVWAATA
jgi:3-oxoadipate enol-lactonase